jgi:hypothetical protein
VGRQGTAAAARRVRRSRVALTAGVVALGVAVWPGATPSVLRLALVVVAVCFLLVYPARGVVCGSQRGDASALPAELNRARRYGRALSLVRFACADGAGAAQDLGATLIERLREDDAVWTEGRNVFVLLPEAARMEAASFVRRFRRTVTASPDVSVVVASFPEDGTTAGALLQALDAERPVPVDVLLDRLGAVVTPAFVDIRNLQVPDITVPDIAERATGDGSLPDLSPTTAPIRLLAAAERSPEA